MSKLPTQPYKGTRDFLPEEMSVRTQIFQKLFRCVELFGFRRYDGPILEPAAIYEAKSGEEIANQQLYRLTDRGGRALALRPEMTPSVARIIAGHVHDIALPARWYSHVNCHRYERPQRGRVREHWQLNVDIFGSEGVEAEIEIFDLTGALLAALGASGSDYLLRVNDRILVEGALQCFVGVPVDRLVDVGMVIDRWEKVDADARSEAMEKCGLDATQRSKLQDLVVMDLDAYCRAAGPEAVERSHIVPIIREQLSSAPVRFDPMIIRALNYYTSTVFEVFDESPTNRRSIFGGGRYDNLVSLFSDKRIPGIGFGMGDVTTWNFLEEHGLLPKADLGPDVLVFGTEPQFRAQVRELSRALRAADIRTAPALDDLRMRDGLKHADRSGVTWVVVVAKEEQATGEVLLKNLKTSEQHRVPQNAVVPFLMEKHRR